MTHQLASTATLIAEMKAGRPIIVIDDEDRENEGDLVMAAETVTEALIAFTIRYTGGVICLAMSNERADRLELPPMVAKNMARRQTAYTVSIEARDGVDTGISAKDRAHTIRTASRPDAVATDLARPGHVFPLRANDGGVLVRRGHTEAAVDFARLAGCEPTAIVSEVMHDNGTMMRLPELLLFGAEHGIAVGTIDDLVAYRRGEAR